MSICLTDGAVTNVYSESNETGTGLSRSVEHEVQNPIYGPGQELESKPGTKTANDDLCFVSEKTRYPSKSASDSSNSVRPRPYDYVDTSLDSEGGTSSGPPAVDPRVRAVYTNTDHP